MSGARPPTASRGPGGPLPHRDRTGSRVLVIMIAAIAVATTVLGVAGYAYFRHKDAESRDALKARDQQMRTAQQAVAEGIAAEAALLGNGDIAGWCAVAEPGVRYLLSSRDLGSCTQLALAPGAQSVMAAFKPAPESISVGGGGTGDTATLSVAGTSLAGRADSGRDVILIDQQPDGRWALSLNYLDEFDIFAR